MNLIQDLQKDILNSETSLPSILRKTKVLEERKGDGSILLLRLFQVICLFSKKQNRPLS